MHYTAIVKHVSFVSFITTIIIAAIAGFFIAQQQKDARVARLIASPTVTDQLAGIELAKDTTLEFLIPLLSPIVNKNNDAAVAAQNLLVTKAFSERRLSELEPLAIDPKLLEAATWWNNAPQQQQSNSITTDMPIKTSVNFLAWFLELEPPPTFDSLTALPMKDRDGSVLLAVLTIDKFGTGQQIQELIATWSSDYDLERNKAAVLLAALTNVKHTFQHSKNNDLATLQTICEEQDHTIAWRALHYEDGTINPDIALAGMLANQTALFPIMIETATNNKWKHPEHPIVLAIRFAPEVARKIPSDLLQNDETRTKWWSLFACGLLLEGR